MHMQDAIIQTVIGIMLLIAGSVGAIVSPEWKATGRQDHILESVLSATVSIYCNTLLQVLI